MTEPANGIEGLQSVEIYEQRLTEFLQLEFPKCPNKALEEMHRDSLSEVENESLEVLIPKIIRMYVDSSSAALSELSKAVMNRLSDLNSKFLVNSEEVAQHIHKIATRKNYGKKSKNQYEDTSKESLWCWELFDNKQPAFVLRERALIGTVVKSLDKLIQEMKKGTSKRLAECFSSYNKSIFSYNKFKEDESERKRKSTAEQMIKEQRVIENLEKKKYAEEQRLSEKRKIEEERKRKNEEISRKKEEEKKRMEEKKEDERKKKIEEERKKKEEEEEKKKKVESSVKHIDKYFSKDTSVKAKNNDTKTTQNPSPVKESVGNWEQIWSVKVNLEPRNNSFIYFTDSFLKPYYLGELRFKKYSNSLQKFANIDYEKDSEEEYEEMNGEDIESINEEDEEESESETEKEEIARFIVNDGYLSADEKPEGEEVPVLSVNFNLELQPMQIFQNNAEELKKLCGISILNEFFPIEIPIIPEKIHKEPKPPKMLVDEHVTSEVIQIALGKISKEEILSAVIAKYPLIPKASVYKIIKNNLLRRKEGKIQVYRIKEIPELAIMNN